MNSFLANFPEVKDSNISSNSINNIKNSESFQKHNNKPNKDINNSCYESFIKIKVLKNNKSTINEIETRNLDCTTNKIPKTYKKLIMLSDSRGRKLRNLLEKSHEKYYSIQSMRIKRSNVWSDFSNCERTRQGGTQS